LQRIEAADQFFAATGAVIRHGGTRAYYAEGPDHVQMPPFETFRDAESYAATLPMNACTGPSTTAAWPGTSGG
jgi:antirestriction protein ArdC